MTFSILARDTQSGEIGCAAATGNLAVGAWVLFAQESLGTLATQGLCVSTLWARQAMKRLSQGISAQTIIDELVDNDPGADYRQIILMDQEGRTAGWTGKKNHHAKGHNLKTNLAVAGNWLESNTVIESLSETFVSSSGTLAARLITALEYASSQGGDSRGTKSAALKVVSTKQPPLDFRVDYSHTPITDLKALYERSLSADYQAFISRLPTIDQPHKC